MDLWMQIEGRKLIFIMNFSVLDLFKFASRMPQIAQNLASTFKIFQGSMPPDPLEYFLFFFLSNSRLCEHAERGWVHGKSHVCMCMVLSPFSSWQILLLLSYSYCFIVVWYSQHTTFFLYCYYENIVHVLILTLVLLFILLLLLYVHWQTEKTHVCEYCSSVFPSESRLNEHRKTHTKPFRCDQCQQAFSCEGKLRKHKLWHQGIMPHQCHVCSRSFMEKGNLISHLRTHTGEKPYRCEYCNKAFTVSSALTVHRRQHTGRGSLLLLFICLVVAAACTAVNIVTRLSLSPVLSLCTADSTQVGGRCCCCLSVLLLLLLVVLSL